MPQPMRFNLAASLDAEEGSSEFKAGEPYKIRALSGSARVLRCGYVRCGDTEHYGYYYLELPIAAADLSRIESGGCPLLYQHGYLHLGVIEAGGKAGEDLELTVRWTSIPEEPEARSKDQVMAADLWRGVAERTRNAYSVGVEIGGQLVLTGEEKGRPVFTAEAWSLLEVSLVDVGADAQAVRLSAEATINEDLEAGFSALQAGQKALSAERLSMAGSLERLSNLEKLELELEASATFASSFCIIAGAQEPAAALEVLKEVKAALESIVATQAAPGAVAMGLRENAAAALNIVTSIRADQQKAEGEKLEAQISAALEEASNAGYLPGPARAQCERIILKHAGNKAAALEAISERLTDLKELHTAGVVGVKLGGAEPPKTEMIESETLESFLKTYGEEGFRKLQAENPAAAQRMLDDKKRRQ